MSDDALWMDRALKLAQVALGRTAPNPAVGAVIVRDGRVLGAGWTRPPGGPHAEVVAVQAAQEAGFDCRGATLFVTLEPCCHHGRTPPCTDAIIEAGIRRVVVGTLDPFPAMRGASLEILRAAGIEVVLGARRAAAEAQILGFARSVAFGLPEVTAKAAISADGHIATASGESQWISGPQAREAGHRLRASHDGILVGIGTVLADDPRLTCRLPAEGVESPEPADPVPVLLDTHLRLPAEARVFEHPRRPVVICGPKAPHRDLPATVRRVSLDGQGRVDMVEALRVLAELGLHRVLVEGGGQVHRSLLDAGLVDRLVLYVAGVILPGGRPWVGGSAVEPLDQARRMSLESTRKMGPDAELIFRLHHELVPDPLAGLRAAPSPGQLPSIPESA